LYNISLCIKGFASAKPFFFGGTFKARLAELCDSCFTDLMKKARIRHVLLPVLVSDQQFSKKHVRHG
ncbi:MAG: hypothetical protein ACKVH1_18355, partial [Alphaproteobacteria bacterium]